MLSTFGSRCEEIEALREATCALFAQGICLATNTQEVVIARGGFERASAVGSYRVELAQGFGLPMISRLDRRHYDC